MGWQRVVIPYKIALKKGANTIRMTASPGRLTEVIAVMEQIMYELNAAYRNISMITGPTPDKYRDYMLDKLTPETFETMKVQMDELKLANNALIAMTGERGSMNGVPQSMIDLLDGFIRKPETASLPPEPCRRKKWRSRR
jgi:hypothetical protein